MTTITSVQHPLVKHLVRLRDQRDYRYAQQSVLLEGSRVIKEVCAHAPAKTLLVREGMRVPCKADVTYTVSQAVIDKISAVEAPEGVIAEVAMPEMTSQRLRKAHRLLALDGVSDPGNLGTLLRTALALGWEGAFLLEGCCDPFNDKALRAARGATFRLPMAQGPWETLDAIVAEETLIPLVADLDGQPPEEVLKSAPGRSLLLVLGAEGQGVSQESRRRCSAVSIPMEGAMESLNVATAGAILMYVLRR